MRIMKSIHKPITALLFAFVMLAFAGCKDLLEEQPRANLVPGSFYKTGAGLNAGLTSAYASFKFYYATEPGMNLTTYGTDEFTHGQQVSNPALSTYIQLTPANGDVLTPWNRAFAAINTCNAMIELGQDANDLTAAQKTALIAEAKYLRAHWYFILVTTFGEVPLDLGSGALRFNTTPTNIATRSTLADVYNAIITDLTQASAELPDKPSASGRAWKASALHLLAKAYLTRGWSQAAQGGDFQAAYNTAKQLIDNKGTYGVNLNANYATNFTEGNEYNSTGNPETLFTVDWIDNLTFNNTQANGLGGDPGLSQNKSHFLFRMLYVTNMPGMIRDVANGRPFVRYKPTPYLIDVAFADKVNDTRYDKSFQTLWRANSLTTLNPTWTAADQAAGIIPAGKTVGSQKLAIGDTAIWMVPNHLTAKMTPLKNKKPYVMFLQSEATDPRVYFNQPNNTFANYAGYNQQNQYYPSLSKFNSTQARAGNDPNISSVRPFIVHRFAETYLIAAEAAFKLGNTAEAANLINVIRTRAAAAGKTAAMQITSGQVTLDFILEERTRELAGEQCRWFDLVRTGTLLSRIAKYNSTPASLGIINPNGSISGTSQLAPNPQSFHVLRPIPQGQIDAAVDPAGENQKFRQNPGY